MTTNTQQSVAASRSAFTKLLKMRIIGPALDSVEVTIPKMFIDRELNRRGITVKAFVENFRARAHFNGFDGVYYTIEPVDVNFQIIPSVSSNSPFDYTV